MSREVHLRARPLAYACAAGHSPAREIVQFLVSEQDLYHANIHLLFQQVGGEAVAQGMHRDALADLRGLGRLMDNPVELARADRISGILARKQPAAVEHPTRSAGGAPPSAQVLEQDG